MNYATDAYWPEGDDVELDIDAIDLDPPRCPECMSLSVQLHGMHSRTGVHTYECNVCYLEWRE